MEINNVKNSISADIAVQQAQRVQRTQEAKQSPQEKPVEQARKAEFYQAPDEYSPKEPEQERLEKQLKAARQELEQKDNDGYRRSHARIS